MKLVIHAGAHKTATTSIQQWLKQSVRPLASAKVLYLEPGVLNNAGIIDDLHSAEQSNHASVANRFLRLLSEKSAKSRMDTILLSHESILSFSNMLPRAIEKGFYGALDNSGPCINKLAEEYDTTLIFYTRRQDTFMASVYLEYIKRGNIFLDFSSYCSAVNYKRISWLTCLKQLSERMDKVEIVVRPFEIIGNGDTDFMKQFLQAAGIDVNEKLLNPGFPRSNESVSETALNLMQACGPHLEARERRNLGQYFRTRFPPESHGKADVLSTDLSNEIVNYFSDENARMFKQWMPDYSEFMY